ncbi:MAG: type I DNA topoisomerase [Acetobacterales bacterium]
MDVVVVESPTKAKTIEKYLGGKYKVMASYGHVRDLPPKDGSVRPEAGFEMDWEVQERADKRLREIAQAVKQADNLYLATDPDREGEAISWHVLQVLRERAVLDDVAVRRVVFNEITKNAVLDAMANPRDVDEALVQAYLARRALDYLVGFTLSPVLWRKLPGSKSAGRVQSVALRLICEREAEIESFRPQEYWSVAAAFRNGKDEALTARLTHLDGEKLGKLSLKSEADAARARSAIEGADFKVGSVERKQVRRHPQPPFTTSTLQQEASRKLRFGASRTMMTAQRLYEGIDIGGETVGLITYMRTDGVQISGEAISACRRLIGGRFGDNYVPENPRRYHKAAKNAQEAHEAIRPTDMFRTPESVAHRLSDEQRKLYELIWKRAVASQMESAVLDQVAVDIAAADGRTVLRATGSVVRFDGFFRLYREDRDDPEDEEGSNLLPDVREGEALRRDSVETEQHFTQPPPRYTEASLVKKLEELGIGRPSTYASIISVLQDRDYVQLENRRFRPEDRGRLVTAFLSNFFNRYVQYNFTAELEDRLDDISGGRVDWKQVLEDFWTAFSEAVGNTRDLTISQVIDALDADLGPHFFPPREDSGDARACPSCDNGRIGLKLGRFGAFIGCSNYPECRYTRRLEVPGQEEDEGQSSADIPRELGTDPETGKVVHLKKGPYGIYVQLGEAEGKAKPKRASVPKGMDPASIDLERALSLLSLPREIGRHPTSGEPIKAGIGRFGPYVEHMGQYVSVPKDEDVIVLGLNRAVTLVDEAAEKADLRTLGKHPEDGKPVTVRKGRFGYFVGHNGARAPLPRGASVDDIDFDRAVQLLADKAARETSGGKGKKSGGKKAPAKASAKKAAPKKAAAGKSSGAGKKTQPKKKSAKIGSAAGDGASEN